jgi:multiple sugar transport system substrate-binding protein
MSVSIPAGTAPDVFSVNALHMVDYIHNGYLLDISDLFENGTVDLANYAPQTYSTSTVNGETWGIPRDFDTIAVFYNKAIFDQANVAYPADDWTWDDFVTPALLQGRDRHLWRGSKAPCRRWAI